MKTNKISEFPPEESSGYLVRDAHRAFQKLLERRISTYGVTRGQWYFLRALWNEDGLSQRELSDRVGMMEPTTVKALRSMEQSGLIHRERSIEDQRRVNVWLTRKGKQLKKTLLPVAREITGVAEFGISNANLKTFRHVITLMTGHLDDVLEREVR